MTSPFSCGRRTGQRGASSAGTDRIVKRGVPRAGSAARARALARLVAWRRGKRRPWGPVRLDPVRVLLYRLCALPTGPASVTLTSAEPGSKIHLSFDLAGADGHLDLRGGHRGTGDCVLAAPVRVQPD